MRRTTYIVLFIVAMVWMLLTVNEIKKLREDDTFTDEEKKKMIKSKRVLVVMWVICALLSLASIVLDVTGLGDTPVFSW